MKMEYKNLSERVFGRFVTQKADDGPLFDSNELEEWAKDLATRYAGDENSKLIPNSGYNGKGCKM